MSQLISPIFGNGHDGVKTVSGTENINTFTSCSGTAGATTLTVTSETGFATGDMVFIHKSRGNTTTTCGSWELNKVVSTAAGSLTLSIPLAYAYQDSGNDQSQCVLIPQYSALTCATGQTLAPTAWGGNVGGILVAMCNGIVTIGGTISNYAQGFLKGVEGAPGNNTGYQGEGTVGVGAQVTGAGNNNGNGGGGGEGGSVANSDAGGGAGGGNGLAGTDGQSLGTRLGGTGGIIAGSADLTTMVFGGGGGAGGVRQGEPSANAGKGGTGGGIIIIYAKELVVTGGIQVNGEIGEDGVPACAGGGGGAGGSILIKTMKATLGTNLLTAIAGNGGGSGGGGALGGKGAVGRIRVEYQTLSGTTNPAASTAYQYFGVDHAGLI